MNATDPDEDERLQRCVGLRIVTVGRTVSASECALMTSLLWTRGPLHTDITVAEASVFGALSLAGPLVAAVASGLQATSPLMPMLIRSFGVQPTALLGSEVRYLRPVIAGDTVHLEITVSSARRSRSAPRRAVLAIEEHLLNQHQEKVAEIGEHLLADLLDADRDERGLSA